MRLSLKEAKLEIPLTPQKFSLRGWPCIIIRSVQSVRSSKVYALVEYHVYLLLANTGSWKARAATGPKNRADAYTWLCYLVRSPSANVLKPPSEHGMDKTCAFATRLTADGVSLFRSHPPRVHVRLSPSRMPADLGDKARRL